MSSVTGFAEFAEDVEDFADGLEDCAGDGMVEVGDAVAEETADSAAEYASQFAPVDTGRLSESILVHPTIQAPMQRLIVAATEYSAPVEYGTFPHIIPPSEETTYDRPIVHPGAQPKPYMRPGLIRATRDMQTEFRREIRQLFRRNLR